MEKLSSLKRIVLEFGKKNKKKIIIYASLVVVVISVSVYLLESTYRYTIKRYEDQPYNPAVCMEGIDTFEKMSYYKKCKNYIKRMKRTGVEGLCNEYRFDEARQFLNLYHDDYLDDMYDYIDERKKQYEAQRERIAYDSYSGRTERVKRMYETMGVGGYQVTNYILQQMNFYLEYGTLEDIGDIFPVWNRNELYLDMVRSDIKRGFDLRDYSFTTEDFGPLYGYKSVNWGTDDYERYLRSTYRIDIDVQDVYAFPVYAYKQTNPQTTSGFVLYIVTFATEGRWFFGGFITSIDEVEVKNIKPKSNYYEGVLIDELDE